MDRLRIARPLLVTTRSLTREAKLLNRLIAAIGGTVAGVYDAVVPHTPRAAALRLAAEIRRIRPDGIISFGGSTTVDNAKAALLSVAADILTEPQFDHFKGKREPQKELLQLPLPHIAIPTTLSGAEYTRDIGITDEQAKTKESFRYDVIAPNSILLDPIVCEATPDRLWMSTGFKVLSDALEQISAPAAHPVIQVLCRHAVGTFLTFLPATTAQDREDRLGARLECQLAAWMTCFATHNAAGQLGLAAALRHQFGARYRMPHGEIAAVLLPHVLRFNAEAGNGDPHIYDGLLKAPCSSGFVENEALPDVITRLLAAFGLPATLRDFKIPREDLPEIALRVMTEPAIKSNARVIKSSIEIEEILVAAF